MCRGGNGGKKFPHEKMRPVPVCLHGGHRRQDGLKAG